VSPAGPERAPRTRGTAHGKVILFGEHAVVYGIPALAVGIDRGAWAEASPRTREVVRAPDSASLLPSDSTRPPPPHHLGPPSTLHVRGWNVTVSDDATEDSLALARALRDILAVTRDAQRAAGEAPIGPVTVEAGADLPPGGGLGCSAALGVAVARAIDPRASSDTIASRVDAWERVFHGNPSGIDAAVSAHGGCVLFQRPTDPGGQAVESENGVELRRSIQRVRVPAAIHLCIGHSGQASSTKSMVEAVARRRERRPEITQKTFDGIHTLVKNARIAIEEGDVRALGQFLDLNQMLLSGLFVSTPEIEQMCATARIAGALGAKLTGAGGGGCVVALVEDEASGAAVLDAWKRDGFEGFATTVGGEVKPARDSSASPPRAAAEAP
jgi:mevalonate kinase